jgi:hypothetical protein
MADMLAVERQLVLQEASEGPTDPAFETACSASSFSSSVVGIAGVGQGLVPQSNAGSGSSPPGKAGSELACVDFITDNSAKARGRSGAEDRSDVTSTQTPHQTRAASAATAKKAAGPLKQAYKDIKRVLKAPSSNQRRSELPNLASSPAPRAPSGALVLPTPAASLQALPAELCASPTASAMSIVADDSEPCVVVPGEGFAAANAAASGAGPGTAPEATLRGSSRMSMRVTGSEYGGSEYGGASTMGSRGGTLKGLGDLFNGNKVAAKKARKQLELDAMRCGRKKAPAGRQRVSIWQR